MSPPGTLEDMIPLTADAALIADESGTVLFATEQACRLLKYAPGELRGQSVELLIPERYRLAHIGHRLRFTEDRRSRTMGAGLELFALCKDGSELPVDLSLNPVQRGLQMLMVVGIQVRQRDSKVSSAK